MNEVFNSIKFSIFLLLFLGSIVHATEPALKSISQGEVYLDNLNQYNQYVFVIYTGDGRLIKFVDTTQSVLVNAPNTTLYAIPTNLFNETVLDYNTLLDNPAVKSATLNFHTVDFGPSYPNVTRNIEHYKISFDETKSLKLTEVVGTSYYSGAEVARYVQFLQNLEKSEVLNSIIMAGSISLIIGFVIGWKISKKKII